LLETQLLSKADVQESLRLYIADLEDFGIAIVRGKHDLQQLQSIFDGGLEVTEKQYDPERLRISRYMMFLVKLKRPIVVEKKLRRASLDHWSYTLTVSWA
jgi:hypothetical protein